MVIKFVFWFVCFFLLDQYVPIHKAKPAGAAGRRVSGAGSNLGKVCREVRDQFRGLFITGMSREGCLAIGSQVDLETRSESRPMESAAEISQASALMALDAFLGHGRLTSKGLVLQPQLGGREEEEEGMWLTPFHSQAQGWQRAQTLHRSPAQQLSV